MSVEPHHGLTHNPGYDFMRLSHWMQEAQASGNAASLAPYFFPILALIASCFAIEGYVDMVARGIDSEWDAFISTNLRFRDRLRHLYTFSPKSLNLGSGVWQEVSDMFRARNELAHPTYVEEEQVRSDAIPTLFERLATEYSSSRSKAIAERAIDALAGDFSQPDLREKWQFRSYWGPPRGP